MLSPEDFAFINWRHPPELSLRALFPQQHHCHLSANQPSPTLACMMALRRRLKELHENNVNIRTGNAWSFSSLIPRLLSIERGRYEALVAPLMIERGRYEAPLSIERWRAQSFSSLILSLLSIGKVRSFSSLIPRSCCECGARYFLFLLFATKRHYLAFCPEEKTYSEVPQSKLVGKKTGASQARK